MEKSIKIVSWQAKDGKRSFLGKEISKEDYELAKRCVKGFERKHREGKKLESYEWAEYYQCMAILLGAASYKSDVEDNDKPPFPLVMVQAKE